MKTYHYSVLLNEVIDGLNIKENKVYVDATVGYAGHSSKILQKCKKGTLLAFDEDDDAVIYSRKVLSSISDNFIIFKENFVNLKSTLEKSGYKKVDGIIFDLGFSSPQIDNSSRGFSFMASGPLDMRMDQSALLTAKKIVNEYEENKLCDIFFKYGEEKLSKKISQKICQERLKKPITDTLELCNLIKSATGANYYYKNHPERQIFQALRIEVNHELDVLEKVLPDAIKMLNKGGRLCVITFHSLEDRIVKNIFKKYSEVNEVFKGLPDIPDEYKPLIKIINKKPILPTKKELEENSRSHSAKLRIVERL